MHVTGIIAEYNPFHNGHRCQLDMVKQHFPDTHVVAVMSGSFTQRGEAALLDKWTRAGLAVQNGCDLVLELPAVFALRSAQEFARGGVGLLSRLGIVNVLAFGSELTSLEQLSALAAAMDTKDVQQALRLGLQQGHSYAKALCGALSFCTGTDEELLRQPNTVLALEYLHALKATGSRMRPLPLPRLCAGHNDTKLHGDIGSARALRRELRKEKPDWHAVEQAVPPTVGQYLKQAKERGLPDMELLFRPLLSLLLPMNDAEIQQILGISEGLEHRLRKAAQGAENLEELIEGTGSRRYPAARIRRLLLCLFLRFTKEAAGDMDVAGPLYARILSLNQRGRRLLRIMRDQASIPIITKLGPHLNSRKLFRASDLLPYQRQLAVDLLSVRLRGLTLTPPQTAPLDFLTSPVCFS